MQPWGETHLKRTDREARLHADLANIARELQRREKQHLIAEEEIERVARSVIGEETSCKNIAEELKIEREQHHEVSSLLKEKQAVITAGELEAQQAKISLSRVEDNAQGHTVDVTALQNELQRVLDAIEGVNQHTVTSSSEIHRFSAELDFVETKLKRKQLMRDEQRMRARAIDVEVQTFRQAASNESSLFAAAMAKAARVDMERQKVRSEQDLRSLQLREICLSLRDEISMSEQECMDLREPSIASSVQLEVHREQQRSQEFLREGAHKFKELKERLEHALQHSEEALCQSKARFGHAEQKLEQQQLAAKLASDQDGLGKYIVEEFSLELSESRCRESISAQEASALSRNTDREQVVASQLEAGIDRLVGETNDVHRRIRGAYVARADYDADAAKSNAARSELDALCASERLEKHMLLACRRELAEHQESLQSFHVELDESRREEDTAINNLKVKEKMVSHARKRLEDIRIDTRKSEVSEKADTKIALESIAEGEEALQAVRQKTSDVEEIVKDVHEEALEFAETVRRKDEIVDIMEVNLSQVRKHASLKEDEARAQVQHVQEEGHKMLRHAKQSMEEMEQEFLAESGSRVKAHKALQAELNDVRQRLQAAPVELEEYRRRIAEERTRSASRVALMLAGFKSSEGARF